MPKQSRSYLKGRFQTGMRPTSGEYGDVFDSFVHKDEAAGVSQSSIDQAIQAYDAASKSVLVDGVVNKLGDVFAVFQGFSDTRKVNDELKWSGLPGRPAEILAEWGQQQTITMQAVFNNQPYQRHVDVPQYPTSASFKLGLQVGVRAQIIDIHFMRFRVLLSDDSYVGDGTPNSVIMYNPYSITFGIAPKIKLA